MRVGGEKRMKRTGNNLLDRPITAHPKNEEREKSRQTQIQKGPERGVKHAKTKHEKEED